MADKQTSRQADKQFGHNNVSNSSLNHHFKHNNVMLNQVQGDNNIKKAGFTLAEVLLVITIIGVVASLTIPDLITSIKETQYIVAWKKSFNQLSAATLNIKEDNGGSMANFLEGSGLHGALTAKYASYLIKIKQCNSAGGCWHQSFEWSDLAGNPVTSAGFSDYGLILNDGSLLRFFNLGDSCTAVNWGIPACGAIQIDTNGFKRPNMIGKDIYGVYITKDGLKPWGISGDLFSVTSNCTTKGWTCGVQNLLK